MYLKSEQVSLAWGVRAHYMGTHSTTEKLVYIYEKSPRHGMHKRMARLHICRASRCRGLGSDVAMHVFSPVAARPPPPLFHNHDGDPDTHR